MVWNQTRTDARQVNVFMNEAAKVAQLIREVFKKKILPAHCINYENHDRKEDETFKELDYLLECETDPFIIHLLEDSDTDQDLF